VDSSCCNWQTGQMDKWTTELAQTNPDTWLPPSKTGLHWTGVKDPALGVAIVRDFAPMHKYLINCSALF